MGIGQHSEGYICKSDISSSNIEWDDDHQAYFFQGYINVDLEYNTEAHLEDSTQLIAVKDKNAISNKLENII